MHDAEFRLLDTIEDDHWWFVGKRLILAALLEADPGRGRLLDLGCGTGGVLREVAPRRACVGLDRSALALRVCRRKGNRGLARGDLAALPFAAASFDTVLALDVIEHLDDDVAFLRRAAGLVAPGGRLLVAVPAFQILWSRHDETLEHRRRYRASQLEAALRAAGLRVERTTYTNFFVFPVAALWRILSYRLGLGRLAPRHDFWPVPRLVNALLVRLYALEARLLRRLDLPVGVSVVCVARPEAAAANPGAPRESAAGL
jgi:SAM-dependent methyltransferase